MRIWLCLVSMILVIVQCIHCRQKRYDGFKVVRVIPETEKHLEILKGISANNSADEIDFWRSPRAVGHPVDTSLSPKVFDHYHNTLRMHGLRPEVTIHDVQKLINTSDEMNTHALKFHPAQDNFNYGAYHNLHEVTEWMYNLARRYSDMVTIVNISQSFEKRPIVGLKISSGKGNAEKPNFFIEGGIHAREWISPATVIYMTGQMLSQYKIRKEISDIVDKFNWYILPVFNVDGYEYTWTHDRTWRKTRSKHPGSVCIGVDPNRNWNWQWGKVGSSNLPCSNTYRGPKAFSEVEVKGVANFMKKFRMKAFIDFHSYSQRWMSPWGYTEHLPNDYNDQVNRSTDIASGCSTDWAYGEAGVKYSYAVELRDNGDYGFFLPSDQIVPTGNETLEALIALANYVHDH